MNKNIQIILVSILAQSANAAVLGWNEGQIVGLRTNNTVGFTFDGAPASTLDANGDGIIDDGQTSFYGAINVDAEGSASLDLSGDDFDWALRFQMYDADGVFGFTENFDDSARVSVTPILSNTNLGARGDGSTLISPKVAGSMSPSSLTKGAAEPNPLSASDSASLTETLPSILTSRESAMKALMAKPPSIQPLTVPVSVSLPPMSLSHRLPFLDLLESLGLLSAGVSRL